jgi:hypothetical protein
MQAQHSHLAPRLAAPPLLPVVFLADVGQQLAVRLWHVCCHRIEPTTLGQLLHNPTNLQQ